MKNYKYNRLYFIFLSLLILLLDQLIKNTLNINKESLLNKDILLFTVDYVKNYGAAFNLFTGSRIFLSLVSITISIILIYIILRRKDIKKIHLFSYSFILGGSLGNGIDRIYKGYVLDYINLKFIDFPIFNIADISINIGIILLLYTVIKYKK